MKLLFVYIIFIVALVSSCKKKKCEQGAVIKEYQINSENFIYGDLYVDYSQFSKPPSLNYFYRYEAIFYKSPTNALEEYPLLSSIKYNSKPLFSVNSSVNHFESSFQDPISTNPLYAFMHVNFKFNSVQLGGANQIIETDTIFPSFNTSFSDTLYLNRSTINTFTVNNFTTNYFCRIELNDWKSSMYNSRALTTGVSEVKFNPSEIKNLPLGVSTSVDFGFYKRKKISSLGRNYFLNMRYVYSYPVKVIN